jgi:hypothetical protein
MTGSAKILVGGKTYDVSRYLAGDLKTALIKQVATEQGTALKAMQIALAENKLAVEALGSITSSAVEKVAVTAAGERMLRTAQAAAGKDAMARAAVSKSLRFAVSLGGAAVGALFDNLLNPSTCQAGDIDGGIADGTNWNREYWYAYYKNTMKDDAPVDCGNYLDRTAELELGVHCATWAYSNFQVRPPGCPSKKEIYALCEPAPDQDGYYMYHLCYPAILTIRGDKFKYACRNFNFEIEASDEYQKALREFQANPTEAARVKMLGTKLTVLSAWMQSISEDLDELLVMQAVVLRNWFIGPAVTDKIQIEVDRKRALLAAKQAEIEDCLKELGT